MNALVEMWLAKAERDWGSAHLEAGATETPNFDAACFHAQQCVEKLMKAVLIARGLNAPKTHALSALSRLITAAHPRWAWPDAELEDLTRGAVELRYPDEDASADDATRAIDTCRQLRDALLDLLGQGPDGSSTPEDVCQPV